MNKSRWFVLISQYVMMTVGVFIGAISVLVFMIPVDIMPTGATGVGVLTNHFVGTPIGLTIFVVNIPIQILAYFMLPGGWRGLLRTLYVLAAYSICFDWLVPYLPTDGVSDVPMLNALFGGVLSGVSTGIVFRHGGSFGGSSTLARIIQLRTGIPMSTTYLYIDFVIVCAAGLTFGWEPALFALVTLFISGVATDYVMEGPSVIRTAIIITDEPEEVADAIMEILHRGVTGWGVEGMYSGSKHTMLFVSMARSQVRELNNIVLTVDPKAFVVISQGHIAYGEGFKRFAGNGNQKSRKQSA